MNNSDSITLCHKCSGTFRDISLPPLFFCDCISSWPRGFERRLNFNDAKSVQLKELYNSIALYKKQGRSEDSPVYKMAVENLVRLENHGE